MLDSRPKVYMCFSSWTNMHICTRMPVLVVVLVSFLARVRLPLVGHNSAHLAADWQVHVHAMRLPSLHRWLRQGPTSEWQVQRRQASPMEMPELCGSCRRRPLSLLPWWLRKGPPSEWPVQCSQTSAMDLFTLLASLCWRLWPSSPHQPDVRAV